ncbi:hypothetical protein K505DRAFT_328798 [Melanomma pulvis-pyrius CBS 109.77]|uniref:Zn(2)-C6 fungal-type domain-containing protein n=1 Tax=Melanomma pulvis-pyrius CBS 109.77 TaxID=1314802 RepID=A0A6A6WY21_9PLEO|nr:hypothetical protein K505DRAFT_328798 [Melanomma pulvis-pyrius CBS 109.77]
MSAPTGVPAFLGFCPICQKAFTKENSRHRHISYCRRTQAKNKGRPKSCVACSSSKTRCTFAKPQCARCESKGLSCVYIQLRQSNPNPNDAENSQPSALETSMSFEEPIGDLATTTLPLSDTLAIALPLESDDLLHDMTDLDQYMSFTSSTTSSHPFLSPICLSAAINPSPRPNDIAAPSKSRTALVRLNYQDLAVEYISDLTIYMLKSFPRMMLRRHTFPPFIHPYWHWSTLPEKLASCMSIAHLFEARTTETHPFLWRVIDAEEQRFREGTETMSTYDIQWASQALMIYIIMAIVDRESDHSARCQRQLKTLEALSLRHHALLDTGFCSTTEEARPSTTWDDWIFAESNRRIGCLWFLICRVFTTHDYPCPGFDTYEHIALVSPKTVWEARTQEEWLSEKAFHDISCPFQVFGELIEAKRRPNDAGNAQRLETWEAGTDKLGLMMNLAVAFV